ncbi:protein of unknown function (plasmid) [Cupriavidus taiwanensis]|uniref:Uncharacterized protein n=1 Tax=Cupriavidus taiwanensis TaxID=164546 RepID=A0A375IMW8_9BURK|nr:protein of unknown function [Cupriavidus taiwanensis]
MAKQEKRAQDCSTLVVALSISIALDVRHSEHWLAVGRAVFKVELSPEGDESIPIRQGDALPKVSSTGCECVPGHVPLPFLGVTQSFAQTYGAMVMLPNAGRVITRRLGEGCGKWSAP